MQKQTETRHRVLTNIERTRNCSRHYIYTDSPYMDVEYLHPKSGLVGLQIQLKQIETDTNIIYFGASGNLETMRLIN
jgi:hypothetical protein